MSTESRSSNSARVSVCIDNGFMIFYSLGGARESLQRITKKKHKKKIENNVWLKIIFVTVFYFFFVDFGNEGEFSSAAIFIQKVLFLNSLSAIFEIFDASSKKLY